MKNIIIVTGGMSFDLSGAGTIEGVATRESGDRTEGLTASGPNSCTTPILPYGVRLFYLAALMIDDQGTLIQERQRFITS